MNKRITSILLTLVLLLGVLLFAMTAYAVSAPTFTVEADKAEVYPGDTITYKVCLQQPDTITAYSFYLDVPEGLTLVADSEQLSSTATTMFGSTLEYVPEEKLVLWYSGSGEDFTDKSKIELMTFQCKVAEDATVGTDYVVNLDEVVVAAGSTQDYDEVTAELTLAKVKVVAKPVAVTGVTVDGTLSLKTGESKALTVELAPADATNKEVTFEVVEGKDVVTVDATGKVTGVKEGTATVKVTSVDGGFSDTCVVTVVCSHEDVANKPANEANCQTGGNEAYNECTSCGQLFDAEGNEIEAVPTTGKDAENHTGVAAWDCTADTHHKTYGCCGAEVVAVENHEWVDGVCGECEYVCEHEGGEATCQGKAECTHCGSEYGELDKENHTGEAVWTKTADKHSKAYNCCGEPVVAEEGHEWVDGVCEECEYVCEHAGGEATCQDKAECTTCGSEYGELDKENHTGEAVWTKTADKHSKAYNCCGEPVVAEEGHEWADGVCGECEYVCEHEGGEATCTDKAECTNCGSEYGELDKENHGEHGTYLDLAANPDHKNQVDGYTGDVRCESCKGLIEEGEAIPAGTHVPGNWVSDGTHHWKECTVEGCGVEIEGTKDVHVSEKPENQAACEKQAKCDVCGEAYGEIPTHEFTKEEVKAEALKTAGDCGKVAVYVKSCIACGVVDTDTDNTFEGEKDPANHANYGTYLDGYVAPDHKNQVNGYSGDAKCNCCDALIEEGHVLLAGEHAPSDWKTDAENHWKECTVEDCGAVIEGTKGQHVSEKPENKAACGKQAVCDVCGVGYGETPEHNYGDLIPEEPAEIGVEGLKAHYQCSECDKYFVDVNHDTHIEKKEVAYEDLIIPALIDNELTVEIPFTVVVEKTGDLDPTAESFTFKMYDFGYEDAEFVVEGLTVDTNGVATYTGKLVIKVKESQFGNLSEGFMFAQVKGDAEGWTYDETVYYIAFNMNNDGEAEYVIFPGSEPWGNTILDKVEFTNEYYAEEEVVPTPPADEDKPADKPEADKPADKPATPETGDQNNVVLPLAMMLLAAGAFGGVAVARKREQ